MRNQGGQEVVHQAESTQLQKEINTPSLTHLGVDLGTGAPHHQIRGKKGVHRPPEPQHPEETHHYQERGSYQEANHLVNKKIILLNTEEVGHQRDIPLHQERKEELPLKKTRDCLIRNYHPRRPDLQTEGNGNTVLHQQESCHIAPLHLQIAWTLDILQTSLCPKRANQKIFYLRTRLKCKSHQQWKSHQKWKNRRSRYPVFHPSWLWIWRSNALHHVAQ